MKDLDKDANAMLYDLKIAFVDIMKKYNLDNSNLVNATEFKYANDSVTMYMPDYGKFIDSGRRAGARQPPLAAIADWVRSNGIKIPSGSTENQLIFAIARSIGQNGIKPKPFLEKLHVEVTEIFTRWLFTNITFYLKNTFENK